MEVQKNNKDDNIVPIIDRNDINDRDVSFIKDKGYFLLKYNKDFSKEDLGKKSSLRLILSSKGISDFYGMETYVVELI